MPELHRGKSPTRGIIPHGVTKQVIRGVFNIFVYVKSLKGDYNAGINDTPAYGT